MGHSLGYLTDVALRSLEGATVTRGDGYQVIRTAANPTFWWGNFLLLDAAPEPGSAASWLDRFAAEFPGAEHVALGIDTADQQAPVPEDFTAAGLSTERSVVLTTGRVAGPPHPAMGVDIRPLAGDADWWQAVQLSQRTIEAEAAESDADPSAGTDLTFLTARATARRALTEQGHGAWFGAFGDGLLLGCLGLFRAGDGLARYQDVATDPSARRRGIAGTLVCHAARYGLDALGARRLVIVADPEGPAIALYRACGFADAEGQVSLSRS